MGDMMKCADDTNVSEYITDQAENSSLQEVTNSIVNWSEIINSSLIHQNVKNLLCLLNGMQPNPPHPPPPPSVFNESQIERADKLSILGLTITRDLKWNDHVEK